MAGSSDQHSTCGFRVLIAIDNSRNAELAFEHYAQQVHKPENEVIVYHVSDLAYPTTHLSAGGVGRLEPAGVQLAVDNLRKKNQSLKEKYKLKCEAAQKNHELVTAGQGPDGPGPDIVAAAHKRKAHLIVVGCRGIGAIRRTILGSVSDYIVHHSHIPTLVCPVPGQKEN